MLQDLIIAVASYVQEHGGYLTKTKLLKLLYLCDVEYYRETGKVLTGLAWKFYHLGPWAATYDSELKAAIESGALRQSPAISLEHDTMFLSPFMPKEIRSLVSTPSESFAIQRALFPWASASTGEILDYVYFRTAPMQSAERGQMLDFGTIERTPMEKYVRTSSGATHKDYKEARKRLLKKLESLPKGKDFRVTPARYDDEYVSALEKLDSFEA